MLTSSARPVPKVRGPSRVRGMACGSPIVHAALRDEAFMNAVPSRPGPLRPRGIDAARLVTPHGRADLSLPETSSARSGTLRFATVEGRQAVTQNREGEVEMSVDDRGGRAAHDGSDGWRGRPK